MSPYSKNQMAGNQVYFHCLVSITTIIAGPNTAQKLANVMSQPNVLLFSVQD